MAHDEDDRRNHRGFEDRVSMYGVGHAFGDNSGVVKTPRSDESYRVVFFRRRGVSLQDIYDAACRNHPRHKCDDAANMRRSREIGSGVCAADIDHHQRTYIGVSPRYHVFSRDGTERMETKAQWDVDDLP